MAKEEILSFEEKFNDSETVSHNGRRGGLSVSICGARLERPRRRAPRWRAWWWPLGRPPWRPLGRSWRLGRSSRRLLALVVWPVALGLLTGGHRRSYLQNYDGLTQSSRPPQKKTPLSDCPRSGAFLPGVSARRRAHYLIRRLGQYKPVTELRQHPTLEAGGKSPRQRGSFVQRPFSGSMRIDCGGRRRFACCANYRSLRF